MVKPFSFASSTVLVSSIIVGFFVIIVTDAPILWAQELYTPVVMWGSLGEGDGQFSGLNDVISTGQYLYVPDYENHRIQMFAADGDFIKTWGTGGEAQGQFISKWGTGGGANGEFRKPAGPTIDSSDNVYVTDQGNGRVQKFTSDGQFIAAWGTAGEGKGQFSEPEGIDVDNSDHIYVADTGNNRVAVFVAEAGSTNPTNMPTVGTMDT
jgi:sugar lactone lactonase YvrE